MERAHGRHAGTRSGIPMKAATRTPVPWDVTRLDESALSLRRAIDSLSVPLESPCVKSCSAWECERQLCLGIKRGARHRCRLWIRTRVVPDGSVERDIVLSMLSRMHPPRSRRRNMWMLRWSQYGRFPHNASPVNTFTTEEVKEDLVRTSSRIPGDPRGVVRTNCSISS